ncbi:MAG TPA: non-homologous end-joining DNA ligase, partial [Acidimicrobiales bacterium]|nr:non-homologous end-joining DNA ligase [Acidimicrobiales bacterium]
RRMAGDRLDEYRSKRDFTRTPEPAPAAASAPAPSSAAAAERSPAASQAPRRRPAGGEEPAARFVVQKHAARRLHYDLRFEVDGVLASWAVPKGPSYDPKEKRLAVHVEDHPLDYRDFEGGIPRGEYGGGRVIVWDEGTYVNLTANAGRPVPVTEAIGKGHLSVWMDGSKLVGGWSLTRTSKPGARQETWILVKRQDERADATYDVTEAAPASVTTGRRLEEIGDEDPTWTRGRATWMPPMLATLHTSPPPDGADWVVQQKFDGLRAIAVRNGDEVELWSRNHLTFGPRFPGVVAALQALPVDNITLDGEVVAYHAGRPSFEALQRHEPGSEPVYLVFDVLHLLGNDTTALSTCERGRLVEQLLGQDDRAVLRRVEDLDGDIGSLLAAGCRNGWEGLVAKRASSAYSSGRSRDWWKLKCDASQELVIGGWTDPKGARRHLGAILVGYYDDAHCLRYAGKVGSGFDEKTLVELSKELARRPVDEPPFADLPRLAVRGAHFVQPELVAAVAFSEWTVDGRLRHPRFQGLRRDKAACGVVRERR